MMMLFFSILFVLCVLFWIGFKLTGALLAASLWLFIKVPLSLLCFFLGAALCCTILLIPLGIRCFKLGFFLLF